MCSILYQPCDEESFRIGPSSNSGSFSGSGNQFPGSNGIQSLSENGGTINVGNAMQQMNPAQTQVLEDDTANGQTVITTTIMTPTSSTMVQQPVTTPASSISTTPMLSTIITTTPITSNVSENASKFIFNSDEKKKIISVF